MDYAHIARRTRSAQKAIWQQCYKSEPVKQVDVIEVHDNESDSEKPVMSEVDFKTAQKICQQSYKTVLVKQEADFKDFHDIENNIVKPVTPEVKERRKPGRPRKCEKDRATNCEGDLQSSVSESGIEHINKKSRDWLKDQKGDVIEFPDIESDSAKPVMPADKEIKIERSVSPIRKRKRGRPSKIERDKARNCEIDPQLKIPESGMKHMNKKSQDCLKNHNNSNHIACDIEKLVKVEVKKQITKLFCENAKTGVLFQKSRMEKFTTSEARRRRRPLQISDSEDEELETDPFLNTQKNTSDIESLEELVTKKCIANIGENQHNYGCNSYMKLEKVAKEKKGSNVKEYLKNQKNSRVSAPVFEENDLLFQDLALDTEEQLESPSKHGDLDEMWKAMDSALKKKDGIEMEESKSPKIENCMKGQGTEEKLSESSLGVAKLRKASKNSCVSTEIKESINGKGDINGDTRQKKRSKGWKPVVAEETKSPFMCLLLDIKIEANIPLAFENIFQNQKKSQEDRDLEEMWKDMELALNGKTLNSGSKMNCENAEDFPEAKLDLHDMYCTGDHMFVLDEEIGIICKICKFVKQEIESILPSMILNTGRNQSRKDYVHGVDLSCSPDLFIEDHGINTFPEPCPPENSVWNLIPSLKENMYAHQQDAFEFLWRNIGGGMIPENMKLPTSDEVGGCVISHAPGTGKTFLIISFLKTYLELFPRSRPLIIAPKNMLFPWEREFKKWSIDIPVFLLNRSKTFWNEIHSNCEYEEIIELAKSNQIRGKKLLNYRRLAMLREWHRRKSVLVISYNLFVCLTCEKNVNLPEEAKLIGKLLLESPGLLVFDEGHQARNSRSNIWNSLKKFNSKLRIILSGTLFQNNFRELFNTLYLVRPDFVNCCLGKNLKLSSTPGQVMANSRMYKLRKFFMDEIGNKIQNGKESGKEEFDETLAKFRLMTDDFVHCYDGKILSSLPGLKDFTVILRASSTQQTVLDQINEANNRDRASNFEFETMVSCVSIHPSLCRDFGIKRLCSGIDISRMEAIRKDPCEGVKTKFVFDLVNLSQVMKEKVLLFSQNIPPLAFLVEIFVAHFSWIKGKEIFQLDGSVPLDERQSIIDQFNDPKGEARILCASIKTCSEGITLTGASRVVFLDIAWNPAIIKQALSRAFRLGQKKQVYIYRLITSGTMEEEKYQRTVWKDCLSTLVFVSPDKGEDVEINGTTQTIHCEDKILNKLLELDKEAKTFHSIFEHRDLKGKRDPRLECYQGSHNLKDKFFSYVG
ncbi:hypothetical protein SUGI_0882020 [Cryptomeria japonica]|uniref:SNF2 domain-containing protein CLASSY 4 n=1 Tax=Cryptomeria japonica TaxID=3369 RepID=UPI0024148DBE|nr:SNF2 domain-containing protein CLASSY 4 [Cryptomeria japonica]XP_057866784.1 SNF2 domain-containing protein CLASSY 4 [Cryptomeria japonica]GLJ42544.1 hypothetical protein SUGI_0882020 [Cryptomeria japonica]